jgi:hypothetical protein
VQRQLDDNEDRQRRSQSEQDGSEICSVELERLIAQGQTLIEKRNAFEMLRDRAADPSPCRLSARDRCLCEGCSATAATTPRRHGRWPLV